MLDSEGARLGLYERRGLVLKSCCYVESPLESQQAAAAADLAAVAVAVPAAAAVAAGCWGVALAASAAAGPAAVGGSVVQTQMSVQEAGLRHASVVQGDGPVQEMGDCCHLSRCGGVGLLARNDSFAIRGCTSCASTCVKE